MAVFGFYKKGIAVTTAFVVFVVFYQNCAGPIQDFGGYVGGSNAICDLKLKDVISSHQGNNKFTLTVLYSNVSPEDLTRVTWVVDGETYNNTSSTSQDITIPNSGNYQITALVYRDGCTGPVEKVDKELDLVIPGQSCDPLSNQVSVAPSPVQVNQEATIRLTNANNFNVSTVKWKINDVEVPNSSGKSEIKVKQTTAGNYNIRLEAQRTNGCAYTEPATLVVNAAGQTTGPANLTGFQMTTLAQTNAERGSGKDAVYKIKRGSPRTLKVLGTSIQSSSLSGNSGTCSGSDCFKLPNITGSSCSYSENTLTLKGTDNSTHTEKIFTYCPAGQNFCHSGRLAAKLANENCVKLSANPNPCTVQAGADKCSATVKIENLPSRESGKVYRIHPVGANGVPTLNAWSCGFNGGSFTNSWPHVPLNGQSRMRLYYGNGADESACATYATLAQLNASLDKVGEDLVMTGIPANLATNVIVTAPGSTNPCSVLPGKSTCSSFKYRLQNLSQFNLQPNQRFYVLPVGNGVVGSHMTHCQSNSGVYTSESLSWIQGSTELRLYKGPASSSGGCIWETDNINSPAYTALASLIVTTKCSDGQQPVGGLCPGAAGGGGTASCAAAILQVDNMLTTKCSVPNAQHNEVRGTCLQNGNCSYRCKNGAWEEVINVCYAGDIIP